MTRAGFHRALRLATVVLSAATAVVYLIGGRTELALSQVVLTGLFTLSSLEQGDFR